VVIVSDTYLSNEQLRTLIARAAGDDVAAMIDRIFCSCEIGRSKAQGMFGPVLERLGLSADTIVHLGDNYAADAHAALAARLDVEVVDAATCATRPTRSRRPSGIPTAMMADAFRASRIWSSSGVFAVMGTSPGQRTKVARATEFSPLWRIF